MAHERWSTRQIIAVSLSLPVALVLVMVVGKTVGAYSRSHDVMLPELIGGAIGLGVLAAVALVVGRVVFGVWPVSRALLRHWVLFVVSLGAYVAAALWILRATHLPIPIELGVFWLGFALVCWWFGTRSQRARQSRAA